MSEPTGFFPPRGRFAVFGAVVVAALRGRLRRYEVREDSMRPALDDGDWVLAEARPHRLQAGQVVVFAMPGRPDFDLVKRISRIDPDGALWVLGDDAAAGSVDSRSFGAIEPDSVSARLLVRYRPLPLRRVP